MRVEEVFGAISMFRIRVDGVGARVGVGVDVRVGGTTTGGKGGVERDGGLGFEQ